MANEQYFPSKTTSIPTIYVYEVLFSPEHTGKLKIGYTTRDVRTRIDEQTGTAAIQYQVLLEESAMRNDGSTFTDKDIHRCLDKNGVSKWQGEWYECTLKQVHQALLKVRDGIDIEENRTASFGMRPEQMEAVERTKGYFENFKADKKTVGVTPRFLWNAKMRFGKTFAAYQLAKTCTWKKILVLTFKPAVQSAWQEDLNTHIDFQGWHFYEAKNITDQNSVDFSKPIVCFGSFQDFLGKTKDLKTKERNKWVHNTHWDLVIFDEYHYGAWRKNATDLFEENKKSSNEIDKELDEFDEDTLPITTNHFLYLSGTPFRAITSGEFIEEQIFNWTYSDEQKAKLEWNKSEPNPYLSLPKMVLMTYQLPEYIKGVAQGDEYNEFDLNQFFEATGKDMFSEFKHESEVQKWLDLIRGGLKEAVNDNLKLGTDKPPMPYSDSRLLALMNHTLWFLPDVASCYAMSNLLKSKNNTFYQEYTIIIAAGNEAGMGALAIKPVLEAMREPLKSKTITLSCMKLTTGVSVKPWTGIFMLRNSSSPETYFQAAFRVQTPWTLKNPDAHNPNKEEIIKEVCYVFDFAPNRALRQIADYSCRLSPNESNPEIKVAEFVKFLPILAYDGSSMRAINAAEILDMAMSGTTYTLLAQKWQSALLVNVDNMTLKRLMDNEEAMKALMNIEGYRTLNQDIETIINKTESIKKLKKQISEGDDSKETKKNLSEEEKKYKSLRKEIQDKLIKFATRIPVFMYLTDYREYSLKDVIQQIEPDLFRKVTGLTQRDFELLVELNVFNGTIMNDAIFKFKRYEDSSLSYTGLVKHDNTKIGGYDTVLSKSDVDKIIAME